MLDPHHIAVAIQDWTKNPDTDKIWVFNSIDKGWEEVSKEEIGNLFVEEGKEHYSFICTGKDPVTLNCVNGTYFKAGISMEKLGEIIRVGKDQNLYCPSLIKEDCYDVLNTIATDVNVLGRACMNGLLYTDPEDAIDAAYYIFNKECEVK